MNKKIVQGLLLATTLIFGSCTDQLEENITIRKNRRQ